MAMDQFLEIDGVKGEAKDKTHKDKIDILSWSWGVSNSGTMHVGGGGGAGKCNVQDLSITKWVDKSTCDLALHACNGKHYPKATLIVRKAGGDAQEYLKYTLTNVLITSLHCGGSGGEDRLTENVTINFEKLKIEYFAQDEKGAVKPAGTMTWDVAANAK